MGRSRRRNRRDWGVPLNDAEPAAEAHVQSAVSVAEAIEAPQRLEPVFVSVGSRAWEAECDAPVLKLDGLSPLERIAGPALALVEEPHLEHLPGDSSDPAQLDFSALPAAAAHDEPGSEADDVSEAAELAPAAEVAPMVEPVVAETELDLEPVAEKAAEPAAPPAPALRTEAPAPEPVVDAVEQLYLEARAAAEAGRRSEARSLYKQVLAQRPGNVRARNNLALLLEADGSNEAALSEYDRALDTDPENVTLLVNRGSLLGQMGRYAAAERDLKKVLRADPSHADALFSLGVVMSRKGLWGEAVPQLRRVVELDPERGAAHFYLGEALNHVDDLSGAMSSYLRAAELMPDHPRALYGLGIVYDRLGRPDDAARMYRKSRDVGARR